MSKWLRTLWTTVWFFPCVKLLMCLQLSRRRKWLGALGATVWFLSCVNSQMCRQIARLCKRLCTLTTTVRFLPREHLHMSHQVIGCCKRRCAQGTAIELSDRMCVLLLGVNFTMNRSSITSFSLEIVFNPGTISFNIAKLISIIY